MEGNEAMVMSGVIAVFCRVVETAGTPRVLCATVSNLEPPSRKNTMLFSLSSSVYPFGL